MAYLPLSTANLPDPAIDPAQGSSPSDYFNTVLYTGDGSTNGDQQAITGVGFAPDWVWLKSRSHTTVHYLSDQVRGVNKTLNLPNTTGEQTQTIFPAFGSDGFTVEYQSANAGTNVNGNTYVAWNWKANGSGVSNTDGSITSTVSANTESGFSIVSYTGTGASATVGHGLNEAPPVVLIKNRSTAQNWQMNYTIGDGSHDFIYLNSTGAKAGDHTIAAPTSSLFTVGTGATVNTSGDNYIAYCFHSVDGFSKIGSYTGNGSADGPFVYTGFRPAFVMRKRTDSTSDWFIQDGIRSTYNQAQLNLYPNLSLQEINSSGNAIDILSNGFKMKGGSGDSSNASGGTYIYMAFAENPFKYSNAR